MGARAGVRRRFWFEAFFAGLGGALTVLTLVDREWIEWLTGMDPDEGSGALEWAIAVGCLAVAVASATLAHREWRRTPRTA